MKNIHTEHCCKKCGCKYGEDVPEVDPFNGDLIIFCSVVAGVLEQSYPCGQNGVCNGY